MTHCQLGKQLTSERPGQFNNLLRPDICGVFLWITRFFVQMTACYIISQDHRFVRIHQGDRV